MTQLTAPQEAPEESVDQLRTDLAAAHRLAAREGYHEGAWGHFSVLLPDGRVLITTPDTHWSRIRASELVEVSSEDLPGIKAQGGALWVAYRIHWPVHEARKDAVCVLHAHPPNATALSTLKDWRLGMVEQNALNFVNRVAYNDVYDGQFNADLTHGREIAAALGDEAIAMVLRNHGVVVTGATVAEAWTRLYLFERTCKVQRLAMSTGREFRPVPPAVAEQYHEEPGFERDYFNAMKRLLDFEGSDYAS